MQVFGINAHESWNGLFNDNRFVEKLNKIEQKLRNIQMDVQKPGCRNDIPYTYFPEYNYIMRFMEQDLLNTKCVMLGMEPYASWYMKENGVLPIATGRSFEIGNVDSWQQKFKQSSLRNILKTVYYNRTSQKKSLEEIRIEIMDGTFSISEPHIWFDKLEASGVIFLNATLTVSPGVPDSHTKMWESAMSDIIQYIDQTAHVKWLLCGSQAKQRAVSVLGTKPNMYFSCHPRLPQFVDENIFQYVPEISWCV
jgi:uracil-DNA glycosylase